eukprot:5233442-Ditylum_brightwellii.AAC.1
MVHLAQNPFTTTNKMISTAQKELTLSSGLARATGGSVSPEKGKNSWYLIEFKWDKAGKWKLVNNPRDIYVNTA